MGFLTRLRSDSRGATAVEYGLIVALIVIAMMVSFMALASTSGGLWNTVHSEVTSA